MTRVAGLGAGVAVKLASRPEARSTDLFLALLLGFSVACNLPVIPGSAASPRLSDLVSLAVLVMVLPFTRMRLRQIYFILAGLCFFLMLTLAEYDAVGQTAVVPFRWCLAFVAVSIFFGHGESGSALLHRRALQGMAFGATMSVLISALQMLGINTGFTAADANFVTANGLYRAPGFYEHPNGNAHTTMLGAAAVLQLSLRSGARPMLGLACFAALACGIYVVTGTRAVLGMAFVMVCIFVAKRNSGIERLWLVLIASCLIALGAGLYWDALQARLFGVGESDYFFYNIQERLRTAHAGLAFLADHPLGTGVQGQRTLWQSNFGTDAVHNGFVWGMVAFGWLFGVLAFANLQTGWRFATQRANGSHTPFGFVLFSATISLFFEDLPVHPSFAVVLTVGALVAFRVHVRAEKGRREKLSGPIAGGSDLSGASVVRQLDGHGRVWDRVQ